MFFSNFENICRLRGISPTAAAVKIGRSKGSAHNWKVNGTIPKENELEDLAECLDCSVADFFYDGRPSIFEEPPDHGPQGRVPESVIASMRDSFPEISNDQPVNEEDIKDFVEIYAAGTNRQRNQLMGAVYDFEQKVLNK